MIEINLLPEEARAKIKKEKAGVGIGPDYLIYVIPLGLLAILACVHLYLAMVSINNNAQLRLLSDRWQKLEPQRREMEEFKKEHARISGDASAIERFLQARICWAGKLDKLSSALPYGIWFSEISVSPAEFSLQGSVVSLKKEEMNLIKQFLDNLKGNADFFADFKTLELGSTQTRTLGAYEITDFAFSGALRTK